MAEFKLGRIRFIWKNNWATGVTYVKDDIVRNGGKTYVCVLGHTADTSFYTDLNHIPTRWNQVSDGSQWKGDWATSQYYKVNDLVKFGGRLYLCNTGHTSNASASSGTSPETTAGLEADQGKWDLYATSFDWKGNWNTTTRYKVDDVVRYGGISYVCNTGHTSASTANTDSDGLEQDIGKWDTYAKGFDWIGNWATGTRYKRNDVVLYGGTSYVCNTGHLSAATATLGLENDQNLWDYFHKGITFLGTWSGSSVRYKNNDVVKYGADLWICTLDHTSSTTFSDATNWSLFVGGLEFENSWSNSAIYQPGDVVSYGGYAYVATTNNTNKIPTSNLSDWDLFTTGFNFLGDWTDATDYRVGDVLRLNGYTYVALLDHTSDALSNIPPDLTNWSRLNSGIKWAATTQQFTGIAGVNISSAGTGATFDITNSNTTYTVTANLPGTGYTTGETIKILGSDVGGVSPANDIVLTIVASGGNISSVSSSVGYSVSWKSGVDYVLGDAVAFGVNSYICILAHTGGSGNRPDGDVTGTYWNLLAAGAYQSALSAQGDIIYMGGAGPTRLPIGTDGQVLRVNGNTPSWSYFGVINNVVYVALNGVDVNGNGQGLTMDKPWRTVRYAARQIEDGYLNPNTTELIKKNKQFLIKEVQNFVQYTFTVTVSAASSTVFTCTSTANLYVGMPISFTGTVGGVTAGTTYYVYDIPAGGTTFGITNSYGSTRRTLTAGSGSMSGTYVYSASKTERDAGIIVDALSFDIGHSGTYKTTSAALAYFTSAGNAFIPGVYAYDITAFVSALNYLKTLTLKVIANTAPINNYQTLNGVLLANQGRQFIDPLLTAESTTNTQVTNLVGIVTTGLTAGTSSAVPAVINPGTTISVKTGTYSEVLPIVVPQNTAVVGDELRSSVVQPSTANNALVNDQPKTIAVLNRIRSIIPNLVTNTTVTPTAGNTEEQVYLGFNGTATSSVSSNTGVISGIITGGLGSVPSFTLPTPTGGTGNAFTAGYFDGARLIYANKAFLQDEISSWILAQIAGNIAPFVGFSYGGTDQTNCERDIGYIVDAVRYDLTYGGNLETAVAARSYYSFGAYVGDGPSKARALAVQARLKSIIDNIAVANTAGWTKTTALSQVVSGTPGSAPAGTTAQLRIQDIYDTINTGVAPILITPDTSWVSTSLRKASDAIQARKSAIQASVLSWIGTTYPALVYNTATCSRDIGYIVDAFCYDLMFGSNFRSSKAGMAYYQAVASAQYVIANQKAQSAAAVTYTGALVQQITTGITGDAGSTASVSSVVTSVATINNILTNSLTAVPAFTFTNPTGYNVGFLAGYGDGKAQIVQNYVFIKDEISSYLNTNFNAVWVALGAGGQANCQRDVGYILDALQYDMTYGGNTQSLIVGSTYYSNAVLTIGQTEKTATIAAYTWLKGFIDNIVTANTVGWIKNSALSQVVAGTPGSAGAATFAQARVQDTIDWITNGTAPTTVAPTAAIALASTALQNSYTALQAAKTEIQSDAVAWVNKFYQAMNFNSATCYRDAGYIVDALSYDLVFGTNFNSVKAGMSYYRATTSAQYVIANQLTAEIGAVNFIGQKAKRIVAYGASTQMVTIIDDMILAIAGTITTTASAMSSGGNLTVGSTAGMVIGMPIRASGTVGGMNVNQTYWIVSITAPTTVTITATYGSASIVTGAGTNAVNITAGHVSNNGIETSGTNVYNNQINAINGAEILRANKAFLASEATAYVSASYGGTVTTSTALTAQLGTSAPHNLTIGDPVVFSGASIGGLVLGTIYYVLTVPSSTTFTLTNAQFSSTVFNVNDGAGSMTVSYSFSPALCKRDMNTYIDAIVYDINYTGNYKSLRAIELYKNAVTGSLLSNMFLLRNGTGLRNMTLSGLTGTLSAANAYGTKRPTAGAYSSLDPGYGPTDTNVWITPRSPYTQNVTMFGTACIGMKIDGALHAGGNRSIVANDYTTILSDGIGVWCTGSNSLTELVSVFTYYSYAGYLAELGGKMRATNGNNSYGTYGSLAEGVDTYEVPITATVNNRFSHATIGAVLTDSTNQIYRLEFTNAGTQYNTATYSLGGTGYNAAVVANEFRDTGMYEARVLTNGANYAASTNVAQGGSTSTITLAATDAAISAAYLGMRVIVTGGSGVGQTGYFTTYNSGTKTGIIARESFDYKTVTGAGSSLITVASTECMYANMPVIFTGALLTGMGTLTLNTIYYVIGATITATQFSVASSSGGSTPIAVGTSASGGGPLYMHAVGWDHIIPGTPIVTNLDLTSAYSVEPKALASAPAISATAGTITSATYGAATYGDINTIYNGSGSAGVAATGGTGTLATFTVTRTGTAYNVVTNFPGTGYKLNDTLTILGTDLGGTVTNNITVVVNNVSVPAGAIQNFTFSGQGAGGYFVVTPTGSAATRISTDGITWSAGGAVPASGTWTAVAYGAGRWVGAASGTTSSGYTLDPTTAWSGGGAMPSGANWIAMTYGSNQFMAIATGSTSAAYSTNGTAWFATSALPANTTWTDITYGNGTFVAVASGGTQAATCTDGISWVTRTLPANTNWSSVTFGNNTFVAVSSNSANVGYSKDGITWVLAAQSLPTATATKVRYGQGVFVATGGTAATKVSYSYDGVVWQSYATTTAGTYSLVAFGNPNSVGRWTFIQSSSTVTNYMNIGAKARVRVKISNNLVSEIRIIEPGSGYTSGVPTITLVDPNQTVSATWTVRTGAGVLANPSFTNRGLQYATALASVVGNGYADAFQTGYYLNVNTLNNNPTAGSNIVINNNGNYYKLVQVNAYVGTDRNSFQGWIAAGGSAPYTARFQMSPALTATNSPAHGETVTMRIKYSQVRLTGHDFLSIGTGGTTTTNYPNTPTQAADSNKQTVGNGGGRVFYTATDQDGNFTVGTLFSVQQATGVASINADAFNLAGLNSLTLGSVALGGSGATITSFSTDQYFTANSDNVVPTQKAIKSYISSQIGGGSSALNVNTLTAGVIYIAGNSISTTTGVQINVTATMNFTGGINGLPVAMDFLLLG